MTARAGAAPLHVMVKPAGPRCNISCAYCYYLEKEGLYPEERKFRMSGAVLESYIRSHIETQAAAGFGEITFTWQGGEPTMLGVDFFRRVVALQKALRPPGSRIRNALQTNGILVDSEWAEFLKEHDFLVGISLDGPAPLHDRYRRDRAGRPTHAAVMRGLEMLRAQGVAFNVLCSVHRHNALKPKEVYTFLRDAGARFIQFIPIVERLTPEGTLAGPPRPGREEALRPAPWSVSPAAFGKFLCDVFDLWIRRDVGRVFVQFFDVQLGLWLGLPSSLCVFAEECGPALALEHNGEVFACDHYVYPEYRLGRLPGDCLADLAQAPRRREFGRAKARTLVRQCRECAYLFACHGGCPKHRFARAADGEWGLNHLCPAYRRFFRHAGPRLEEMARLVRAGRPAAEIGASGRG